MLLWISFECFFVSNECVKFYSVQFNQRLFDSITISDDHLINRTKVFNKKIYQLNNYKRNIILNRYNFQWVEYGDYNEIFLIFD